MKILLVEDDQDIADLLKHGLGAEGYDIHVAGTIRDGEALAGDGAYDVLLLDIMLPDGEGHDLCRRLRAKGLVTPILILTALDGLDDKVRGLRSGADDYLCKPFEFEELLARIEALARRSRGAFGVGLQLRVADLSLDPERVRVTRSGRKIPLTSKEFAVLRVMMGEPDCVFARDRLLEEVWGTKRNTVTNVVEVCIGRLRKKIDGEADKPLIHTIRGHGYKVGPA